MGFTFESADLGEFFSIENHPGKGLIAGAEKIVRFDTPKGEIVFEEIQVSHALTILQGQYQWNDDIALHGKGDTALLEMHFNLSADSIYYRNKVAASDRVAPMSGNITYLAADDNVANIGFQNNILYNTFDIHLPLTMLTPYEGESQRLDAFLQNIHNNRSTSLSKEAIKVNAKMFSVIQDIRNCTYEGLTRRIYLESKTYELLALCYDNSDNLGAEHKLSPQDLERLHFAAQTIRENLDNPFTIIDLARKAGINQTKLKQGFKSVFGDTVFGYLQQVRMEQARQYLLDTNLSIQEISTLSGYQSVSNFSSAFKKKFRYSPNTLRKR